MPELLTGKQAHQEFGFSPASLKRWESEGRLTGVIRTPGGQRRYPRESLKALLAQPVSKANGTPPEDFTNPKNRHTYSELGTTGLSRFSGSVYTEEQRELRGSSGRKIYREMRLSDPVIAAVFFAVGHAIKQTTWRSTPVSEKEADKQVAEWLDSCLEDMSFTWNDTMTFIADSMLEQGLAIMEPVYKKRLGENPPRYTENPATSNYDDGKIGWRKLAPRPVESLVEGDEWIFDDHGGVQGVNQMDPATGKMVSIPVEKLLIFRTTVYPANTPEPPPIHRAAYRPYYYTSNLEEIEGIGVERDLGGVPVIYMGKDLTMSGADSDYELAKKLVVNIRRDEQTGVVLPGPKMGAGATEGEGWLLELLSAQGSRAHDITAIVERYDRRKALTVLAQFIMLGMNQVGSYALSRHQGDLFVMAVTAWVNSIAEIFNRHAIPRLMKLNSFPGITGYPKLTPSAIGVPDLAGIAEYVNKLVDKAVLTPDEELERHLRQLASLPERVEPEEVKPGDRVVTPAIDGTPAPSGDAAPENLESVKGLNGAQITAALDILAQVSTGSISPTVGIELLVSLGLERERAVLIIRETQNGPKLVRPDMPEIQTEKAVVIKAERAGKLSTQGKKALALTDRTQAEIEKEWQKLQDSINEGMAIKGAISLYKRNIDRLLDTAFDEAWAIGRGGQFDPEEREQVEAELVAQRDYLDSFAKELLNKLEATTDRQERGGILLANAGRAAMYAGAVWGLYNTAKIYGASDDSLWAWEGVIDSKSCVTCREEMAAGARPLSKISRWPGVDTDCLVNCRHEIVRVK